MLVRRRPALQRTDSGPLAEPSRIGVGSQSHGRLSTSLLHTVQAQHKRRLGSAVFCGL